MEFKTLQDTSLADITAAFNEAFSDYIIPVKWTEADAAKKFQADNVDLSLSPGFFVDGKLRGFIFHFIGEREGLPIIWNGGTGVVPDQRGQGITTQLYDFILPAVRNKGFDRSVLEVIEGNDSAIHIYKKNGFSVTRKLDCYKGEINKIAPPDGIVLTKVDEMAWDAIHALRSWQPTFQNNDPKLIAFSTQLETVGAFDGEELIGYIIFVKKPEAGDVYQFAVKESHRGRGLGKALFARAAEGKSKPLRIINVDASHYGSAVFFEKIGFEKTVSQFEMIKSL